MNEWILFSVSSVQFGSEVEYSPVPNGAGFRDGNILVEYQL